MEPLIIPIFGITMTAAYLFGSIPFGILLTRIVTGKDIRQLGSGNVGAANVGRVAGKKLGVAVLLADIMKGALPVCFAMGAALPAGGERLSEIYAALTALSAVAGHMYPAYFRGRSGGKGVATALGCFAVISPAACMAALLLFILVAWLKRTASISSLSAVAALPLFVWLETRSPVLSASGLVTATLIFIRHADNIRRIKKCEEPVWRAKR